MEEDDVVREVEFAFILLFSFVVFFFFFGEGDDNELSRELCLGLLFDLLVVLLRLHRVVDGDNIEFGIKSSSFGICLNI